MCLFSDYVNGGELFTHLNIREKFSSSEVQLFSAEILLALEHLHKVSTLAARSPDYIAFGHNAFFVLIRFLF